MLLHFNGTNRGEIRPRIYGVDQASGCVMVGDSSTRLMLTRREIVELHSLLAPFAEALRNDPEVKARVTA